MDYSEFVRLFGSPASVLAALAALTAAVFAGLNWLRARTLDAPTAHLGGHEVGQGGMMQTHVVVVSRGASDTFVRGVELEAGTFAVESEGDGMGGWSFRAGTETTMVVNQVVPVGQSRSFFARFFVTDQKAALFAHLVPHGDAYVVKISGKR